MIYRQTPISREELYKPGIPFVVEPLHLLREERTNLHYHTALEIVIYHDMRGTAYVETSTFQLEPLSVLIVPSKQLHYFHYTKPGGHVVVCHLNLRHLNYYLNWSQLLDYSGRSLLREPRYFKESSSQYREIKPIVDGLLQGEDMIEKLSLLIQLFKYITSGDRSTVGQLPKQPLLIHNIVEFTEKNISGPLSMKVVAKALGYSKEHLIREFKRCTQMTYSEYLINLRLRHAKKLLEQEYDINQVTNMLGMANPSYFIRLFKQHTGETPKQYQRLMLAK